MSPSALERRLDEVTGIWQRWRDGFKLQWFLLRARDVVIDVFISYASEDRERVRPLVVALERVGLAVWWDQHIGAGESWDRSIERAITDARCVLAIASRRSVESRWSREEALVGLEAAKLVPVAIDAVELPLGFRTVQSIRIAGLGEEAGQALVVRAVREFLERRGDQPPAAAQRAPDRASIVVLPFANLGSSEETGFFVAGIHEDLLSMLARIDGLDVISRTTAVAVAQMHKTIREIAKELDVTHVLEGGVRRAGDRVRISVKLIEAATDRHVWDETHDRQLTDIFAVQDELARTIAEKLRVRLDPAVQAGFAKAQTKSIEAYDCMLKAEREWHRLGWFAAVPARMQHSLRAIELDPHYAAAYGSLAQAHGFKERGRLDSPDVRAEILKYAQKALEIDPNEPRALVAMAWIAEAEQGGGMGEVGLPYIARGLAAYPGNAMLHDTYGNRVRGYRERAVHRTEAYRLDPLQHVIAINYVTLLADDGRVGETLDVAKRAAEIAPDNPFTAVGLATAHFANGDEISGLRQLKRAVSLSGVDAAQASMLTNCLTAIGCIDLAARWLNVFEGPGGAPSKRAWRLLFEERSDDLAAFLDRWGADSGSGLNVTFHRAHLDALRADVSGDALRGEFVQRSLVAFDEYFSATGAVPTRYGRIGIERAIDSDWLLGYLRYAAVARHAHDGALIATLDARLEQFFAEEAAPVAMPLERGIFAAMRGDCAGASDWFERAAARGLWSEPVLKVVGVTKDRDAVFSAISDEPRFRELLEAQRSKATHLRARIARELPDLEKPESVVPPPRPS